LLTNLADELLVQDITEPSAGLGPLGKLVIDTNHGPIHLLQAAFYAVRLEVQRRGVVVVGC
jgi:hypothetical protein